MKEKRKLLIGLFFSIIFGSILVFYSSSFIINHIQFLLGFIFCLVLVISLVLAFFTKKTFLNNNNISNTTDSENTISNHAFIWIAILILIVVGGSISSIMIYQNNKLIRYQDILTEQKSALIESERNSSLVHLMANILDKIDNELIDNSKRVLSNETIDRIVALSYSFKPYRYFIGDSLSEKYSPERGQLLLALSKMNLDSSSFDKIKLKASFSEADLRGADLKNANLSWANLKDANLKDADLREANLYKTDLRNANLWGANLRNAIMKNAVMKRANLSWADMSETDLRMASLDGADLTSTNVRKADLTGASLKFAKLNGAFFNESDLTGADLNGTDLTRANLSKINLSETNLIYVNLSEANLNEADLSKVKLNKAVVKEENWLEKLNEWQVTGAKEIQETYKVVKENPDDPNCRLEKIKD